MRSLTTAQLCMLLGQPGIKSNEQVLRAFHTDGFPPYHAVDALMGGLGESYAVDAFGNERAAVWWPAGELTTLPPPTPDYLVSNLAASHDTVTTRRAICAACPFHSATEACMVCSCANVERAGAVCPHPDGPKWGAEDAN